MLGRGGRRNLGGGGSGGGTFLEVLLNLSDLNNVSTARTNLGFNAQTAGNVLLGDGSTTFTSDPLLFFDTTNKRLGLGTNAPSEEFHILKTTAAAVALLESQSTGNPSVLKLESSRTAIANLANGDTAGRLEFLARANAAYADIAFIDAIYQGNGTTQSGDLVFKTANGGAPAECLRLTAAGAIDTTLSAGTAYFDASGILSSLTTVSVTELGYLDGVTSAIQTQLNAITGAAITSLTGDVTATGPGAAATTIGANKVTLSMMAQVATATFLGRTSALTGNVEALTVTQATAMLNTFVSGGAKGLVPDATGSTAKFLRGDATWVDLPAVRYKSGKTTSLTSGTTTKAITFATARADALYTPSFFLINTVDTNPIGIPVRVIAISSTGFTAEWDDALPTGNYVGYWSILEHYDP